MVVRLVLLSLLTIVGGCGEVLPSEVAASRSAIVGAAGQDTDANPMYPAVVQVRIPQQEGSGLFGSCSGTLVSPSHVVTAAHCFGSWNQREPISVEFGAAPACFGTVVSCSRRPIWEVAAAACEVHPDYNDGFVNAATGEPLVDEGECGGFRPLLPNEIFARLPIDIAVLTLATPVPEGWAETQPLGFGGRFHELLPIGHPGVADGDAVAIVGYGRTVGIGAGDGSTAGVRRFANTTISDVYETDPGGPGTSSGDSGGPALWNVGGPPLLPDRQPTYLVAVSSQGVMGSAGHLYAPIEGNEVWVHSVRDRDGDGRYDFACPGRPELQFEPATTEADDFDGDGAWDSADNCPNDFNPCQADFDGDGEGDACDGNPLGIVDSDGDGRPDETDNCPFVPNSGQEDLDVEDAGSFSPSTDGVGDACDNCPDHINPNQENCNYDAELAAGLIDLTTGAGGVGDACDPTPCPDTRMDVRQTSFGGVTLEARMDLVQMDGLRTTEPADPTYEAWTGLRFCPCDVADDTLEGRSMCELEGCAINDTQSYDFPSELDTWRRVSAAFPSSMTTRGSGLTTEAAMVFDPPTELPGFAAGFRFESDGSAEWNQPVDVTRWNGSFGDNRDFTPASPLQGVLWSHVPGDFAGSFSPSMRELTSHYWSGAIDAPRETRLPQPCSLWVGPYAAPGVLCPSCGATFPMSFVGAGMDPGCFNALSAPEIVLPFDALDAARMWRTDPPDWFLDPYDPVWTEGRWVWAADFAAYDGLRYVSLDSATGEVRHAVFSDAAATDGPGLAVACEGCGGGAPPHQGEYFATASARHGSVWIADRSGLGLWRWDLATQALSAMSTSDDVTLGEVLAITYDGHGDFLFMLDDDGAQLRLIRLDPVQGGGAVLGTWPRQANVQRYELTPSNRGHVVLASSLGASHCAALVSLPSLRHGGIASIAGLALGDGAIQAGMVVANERGVSVMTGNGASHTPVGHDYGDMVPPTPDEVAGCF